MPHLLVISYTVGDCLRLHHGHARLAHLSHRRGLTHRATAVRANAAALRLTHGQAAASLEHVAREGPAAALAAVGGPQLFARRLPPALLTAAGVTAPAAGSGYGGHEPRDCRRYL